MVMQSRFTLGVKKVKVEELVRREVLGLQLYEAECGLERKLDESFVKLDLNENFAVTIDAVRELLSDAYQDIDVRLYPPSYGSMAIKAISDFLGVRESEISVGNGADEVLDLLMKVFVEKGSKVLVVEPTFPMYAYFIQLYGGKKVNVLLRPNFEMDTDSILKRAGKETGLLILCSPNNPTGNQFKIKDVRRILQEFEGVVVVDEAYVDFARYTAIDWLRDFDNLVVLRTFSKAFGLAGIRFGFLVSNKSIVEFVKRVTSPFNLNIVTQRLITLALKRWDYFEDRIRYIKREREWLRSNLAKIDGITPYHSDTNFILFKVTQDNLTSSIVTKRLKNRNVLVKDRGNLPLLENCIRVTVGTRDMNLRFLSTLEDALEK